MRRLLTFLAVAFCFTSPVSAIELANPTATTLTNESLVTPTITSATLVGAHTGAVIISETGGTCDPDVLANTMGICNIDDQGGAGNVGMGIYIQQAGAGDNYGISVDANGGFYELHGNFTGAGTMSPIRQYTSDDSHTLGGRGTGGGGAAGTTPAFAFNGSSGKVGIFESAPNGQFDIAALAARRPTDPLVQVSSQNAAGVYTINVNGDTDQAGSETVRSSSTINGALKITGGFVQTPMILVIADDAAGTSPGFTLDVSSASVIYFACNDTSGEAIITMGESNATTGQVLTISNNGSNNCHFADTSGLSELAGAFAMGPYDAMTLRYVVDRWAEIGRSNN